MAGELSVDKCRFRMNMPLELLMKVRSGFSKPADESDANAVVRALEEATRNVLLTKKEYKVLADMVSENMKTRLDRREKKKAKASGHLPISASKKGSGNK